jgi:hypothetical protein
MMQSMGTEAKRDRNSVAYLTRPCVQNFASADLLLWTKAEPRSEG